MNKNTTLKPGYQNQHDAMRELAEKSMSHPGYIKDSYPPMSSEDKPYHRLFKEGGRVMKENKKMEDKREYRNSSPTKKHCDKFAAGGVAKIRHGESTIKGAVKSMPKKSIKNLM